MKQIEWHRAERVEYVDPDIHANRAFLYPTPVLREDIRPYFDYDVSGDIAISFSLFTKPSSPPTYPECMCKQAMWMAKHLCMYTDLKEAGIPLYIGIALDTVDTAMPYLQACNFPTERVFFVEGEEQHHEWISKYEALWDDPMSQYNKVIHMDVCYLIGRYPTQRINPIFSNIREQWFNQPMMTCAPFLQRGGDDEVHPIYVRLEHHWGNPADPQERKKADDDYWHFIAKQLGSTPEAEQGYWHCGRDYDVQLFRGGIYGFMQSELTEEFKSYFRDLLRFFNCDEAALALYAKQQGWTHEDIIDLGNYFAWTSWDYEHGDYYGPANFMYYSRGDDMDYWLSKHTQ